MGGRLSSLFFVLFMHKAIGSLAIFLDMVLYVDDIIIKLKISNLMSIQTLIRDKLSQAKMTLNVSKSEVMVSSIMGSLYRATFKAIGISRGPKVRYLGAKWQLLVSKPIVAKDQFISLFNTKGMSILKPLPLPIKILAFKSYIASGWRFGIQTMLMGEIGWNIQEAIRKKFCWLMVTSTISNAWLMVFKLDVFSMLKLLLNLY